MMTTSVPDDHNQSTSDDVQPRKIQMVGQLHWYSNQVNHSQVDQLNTPMSLKYRYCLRICSDRSQSESKDNK